MIQIKARKQGGAVIITIPAGLLKLRGIKAGDALDLDVTPDGFVIRKVEATVAATCEVRTPKMSLGRDYLPA